MVFATESRVEFKRKGSFSDNNVFSKRLKSSQEVTQSAPFWDPQFQRTTVETIKAKFVQSKIERLATQFQLFNDYGLDRVFSSLFKTENLFQSELFTKLHNGFKDKKSVSVILTECEVAQYQVFENGFPVKKPRLCQIYSALDTFSTQIDLYLMKDFQQQATHLLTDLKDRFQKAVFPHARKALIEALPEGKAKHLFQELNDKINGEMPRGRQTETNSIRGPVSVTPTSLLEFAASEMFRAGIREEKLPPAQAGVYQCVRQKIGQSLDVVTEDAYEAIFKTNDVWHALNFDLGGNFEERWVKCKLQDSFDNIQQSVLYYPHCLQVFNQLAASSNPEASILALLKKHMSGKTCSTDESHINRFLTFLADCLQELSEVGVTHVSEKQGSQVEQKKLACFYMTQIEKKFEKKIMESA